MPDDICKPACQNSTFTKKKTTTMSYQDENHSTGVTDVKQLGLFAALGSLGYVFWVLGGMEMIELLADRSMDAGQIDSIPQGESFTRLVEFTGETPAQLTELLYQTHNIRMVWYVMAVVGFASAYGLYLYGRWAYQLVREDNGLNGSQGVVSDG